MVCRTGYTGEHGFELVAPNEVLVDLWNAAVAAAESVGGLPAGLGARDTLRTEMGYPLHGQDISPTISPVTAGLGWAIGWDKPEFAGREVLLAEKAASPTRRLRGILANHAGPTPFVLICRYRQHDVRLEPGAGRGVNFSAQARSELEPWLSQA